jgi:hypothetical protein
MMHQTRKIGRTFPYRVTVSIAAEKRVADMIAGMYRFCHVLGWECRMLERQTWDPVIWCFENPLHAHTFHQEFGGELVTVTE